MCAYNPSVACGDTSLYTREAKALKSLSARKKVHAENIVPVKDTVFSASRSLRLPLYTREPLATKILDARK